MLVVVVVLSTRLASVDSSRWVEGVINKDEYLPYPWNMLNELTL